MTEIQDRLWQQFIKEIVPLMNTTNKKWLGSSASLKPGDVCVLCEPKLKGQYPLARVVKVYPNKDGIARVADVIVGGKVYRRSLTRLFKLCALEECP